MDVRIVGAARVPGGRRRRRLLFVSAVLLAAAATVPSTALASHPEVSLPGSDFEIDTDANLRLDDPAPSLDWANVAESRRADRPTGAADDSFGQGTKEDSAVPTVVDGGIPPNKSDLLNFGVYLERTGTGRRFLHTFWHRVQEPSGTTNMDFEFNQSRTPTSNGVTPVRTAGDLLIQYDLSQGGDNPVLWLSRWVTAGTAPPACEASNSLPCWGPKSNLTAAGTATGSINASAIPSTASDGLGDVSARTFGEATVDFDALTGGDRCVAFGSAYLKSRSSDSFTAALKDFVAPEPISVSNCGSVRVLKTNDAGAPLNGAEFTLFQDNPPVGGGRGAEDTVTAFRCTTGSAGNPAGQCTIGSVLQGRYWLVETVVPAGHSGVPDVHVTVVADQTITVGPLVDPRHRGAIMVTKLRKHAASGPGDHPHAGVAFTVNGVTRTTGADGRVCFDNLLFGSYPVREIVPAGYRGEADRMVTVDSRAGCSGVPFAGESVTFHNTPLSDVTVSFSSQVPGGTAARIGCAGLTATPPDATPDAFDDGSEAFRNLPPGTYTCTVVVDP
jgi:hypothetical protein